MASIYEDSKSICAKLTTCIAFGSKSRTQADTRFGHQWRRKFYKSCIPIKAKLMAGTILEPVTPLNLMDIGNEGAINLLLLDK